MTCPRRVPRLQFKPRINRAPSGGGEHYRQLEADLPRVFDFTRGALKCDYVDPTGRRQSAADDQRKRREGDGRARVGGSA